VATAGGKLVELGDATEPDVVVLGHSTPHDWKSTLEALLSLFSQRFTQKNPVRLLLPNPDFIYPNGPGEFGFGAAVFVDLLEQALKRLHGSSNVVMIGDQLETDILGANRAGIGSAVVTTGINRRPAPEQFEEVADELTPRCILASLV
jgi:ribonucleotide monophosphatase NagD (HAD superfamily)